MAVRACSESEVSGGGEEDNESMKDDEYHLLLSSEGTEQTMRE